MTFQARCEGAKRQADEDRNYIGAVCRFNQDDNLIFTTRNYQYGTSPDELRSESGQVLEESPTQRLRPIKLLIDEDLKPLYKSTVHRELEHWEATERAISSGNSDYSMEALHIYRSEYVKVGLAGPEWLERAEKKARQQALDRIAPKLRAAKNAADGVPKYDAEALQLEREKIYGKIHGTPAIYPPEYVDAEHDGGLPGGHAEEYLIKYWPSAVAGLKLTHVDLFITRMPCATNSSGFLMGGIAYKEGCVNKLIQLVDANKGVQFDISYYQALDTELQRTSQSWANSGFPSDRTLFHRAT